MKQSFSLDAADTYPENLKPLREKIDVLDTEILNLINQRASLALQIGAKKHARGEPVYRPEREAQILLALKNRNVGPLKTEGLQAIWREIMSACRAIEAVTTVAYLGPAGTYSEQAVLKQFGSGVSLMPCKTIDAVFRAVEADSAQFGIVPVENSTEGVVSRTLDLLLTTPLSICAEMVLPIEHHLLGLNDSLKGVTRIVGHAQALAQCQAWLAEYTPNIQIQAVTSNGEGARLASVDPCTAALAGSAAQSLYNLKIIHPCVQDDINNRTRFVVIGTHLTQPSINSLVKDQTSLIVSVDNNAGAVYAMLKPLADHGVNMTRLESRPARTGSWEYYFYIDVAGHALTPSVTTALLSLKNVTAFYKLLGSYPLSVTP
jgi:chorismate mutase/prephenate dehydratase